MARFRSAIPDFQLANPMYSGATVTFYVADADGSKTDTLATLYRGATGSTTVNNPVTLDAEGKFSAPIFHDTPIVAEVLSATVGTHETGPIAPRGTFKDDWAADTRYSTGDTVRDGTTGTIYLVPDDYTSAATIAADIAAGNLILLVDSTRVGFLFRYSSTTTQADPGAGYFRFDNATIPSVTAAVVDATSQASGNPDVSDALAAQKNNFSETTIIVYSQNYPDTVWAMFTATAITDNTGYISYTLTYVDHAGAFTNGELCRWVQLVTGDHGFAFHAGDGAPSSGLGRNGDTYLDRETGTLYAKSAGSWAATAEQVFADAVTAAEAAQEAAELAQTNAEASETAAAASESAAALSAGIAAAAQRVYTDTATALALVGTDLAVGDYFYVPSSDSNEFADLYLIETGPVATYVDTVPNADLTRRLATEVTEIVTVTGSGTDVTDLSVRYWPQQVMTADAYLTRIKFGASAAGTAQVIIASVSGTDLSDGEVVDVVAFSSGANWVELDPPVAVPAGWIVGIKPETANTLVYTAATNPDSAEQWYTASVPTTTTARSFGVSNGVQFAPELKGATLFEAEKGYEASQAIGDTFSYGWPTVVNTGDDVPGDFTIVLKDFPITEEGKITLATIGADGAGTATISIVKMAGNDVDEIRTQVTVSLTNAVVAAPLDIDVVPVGGETLYVAITGGGYKFQNSSNPLGYDVWLSASAIAESATLTPSALHRYEVLFTFKTGLESRVSALEGQSLGAGTGLGLLSDADESGATDATADFTSARSTHEFPQVPDGTFDTTAVPSGGEGLWGSGTVLVNDNAFFIPKAPRIGNLFDSFRAALMEHIANDDVLTLIADSIGEEADADSGADHHFNRLCRFANLGIAEDEPIMTSFRSHDAYTAAFYGVTISGGSVGSIGPLGESLILAAGDYIEFTGTYEQVDVFAKQVSGAGTLTVSFNTVDYDSTSFDGATTLDVHSGWDPTGESGSGTYRITASGGSVEITGLIREGPLTTFTAVGRKRLRCLRAARGGYLFQSFTTAALTSILAQASHWGGKAVPIIALGINDAINIAPSAITSTATAVLDTLEAGGVERIFGAIPIRPTSTWNTNFSTRNYEEAIGAIRSLYRSRGVDIIALDGIDWAGMGRLSDGLHPGGSSTQRLYTQAVIEGIIRADR